MTEEILIDVKLPGAEENEKRVDALTTEITELTKAQQSLREEQTKLTKAGKDNSQQYLDNAKQIEINKQKINENTASRKGLIQTIIAEDNSIKGLRVQNAELIKQRDQINTKTKEGQAAIQRINSQIDHNTNEIRKNSSAMEDQKMNIGNYASALDRVIPGLGGFASGLTNLINPLTATAAGVGALVSLYAKSTIGAKDLEFASNQLGAAINLLGNSFASLVSSGEDGEGFISKFTNSILFSIDPATAAISKLAAQNVEKLEDLGREAKRALSEQQELLADNADIMQQVADSQVSYNDKLFLTSQAIDNVRTGAESVKAIRIEELSILEQQLALDQNNEDLQDAILDKKLQIAQEDKKTERLVNNILKIESNLADAEQKRIENIQNQNAEYEKQAEILANQEQMKADMKAAEIELDKASKEILLENQRQYDSDLINQMEAIAAQGVDIHKKKTKEITKLDVQQSQIHELQEQNRLHVTSMSLGLAANAFKKHTIAYKLLASSQVVMDTYQAATMAYKNGQEAGYPASIILSPLLAGLAIAAGLANLAKVNGVELARGGILGKKMYAYGGISETGGVLNGPSHAQGGIPFSVGGRLGFEAEGGEAIINKKSTAMYRTQLSQINMAGGGRSLMALGGIASNETRIATQQAQAQFDINQMANLINKVQPILVLQDFEAAQNEKNVTQSRANVI